MYVDIVHLLYQQKFWRLLNFLLDVWLYLILLQVIKLMKKIVVILFNN